MMRQRPRFPEGETPWFDVIKEQKTQIGLRRLVQKIDVSLLDESTAERSDLSSV